MTELVGRMIDSLFNWAIIGYAIYVCCLFVGVLIELCINGFQFFSSKCYRHD